MKKLTFWKQKIIQAFHDPPSKPYALYPGTGGHRKLAQQLFAYFTTSKRPINKDAGLTFYPHRPDMAAAGADRPVFDRSRRKTGKRVTLRFDSDGNNIVTHPLAAGEYRLRLTESAETNATEKSLDLAELFEEQREVLENIGPVEWTDADALHHGFWPLWRRFRDDITHASQAKGVNLLWDRMPAESRAPDHAIWEHLKVVSALAFLTPGSRQKVSPAQEPWLFSFSLHPVQSFIEESRTSRDLWVSSFLIADLAWHAMLPIVEHYGPDVIIYPDLRGNTRVDNWLYWNHKEALPENSRYPATYAALLPNTFTAILPAGGKDYLKPIDDIARACVKRMRDRWRELQQVVRDWLPRQTPASGWESIWDRQHKAVFSSYWTAVQWKIPERIEGTNDEEIEREFQRLTEGGALPAQNPELLPRPNSETLQAAASRRERLAVWMPDAVWAHYERARTVFGRVNISYVQNERGFDYALAHHELRVRHRIRKQEARYALVQEEPNEKCTQCRKREALRDTTKGYKNIDDLRDQVSRFWQEVWEKRREPDTTDRLCGMCAFKRFLVDAGGKDGGINKLFRDPSAKIEYDDDKVRVPFASTSAIAAQEFLAKIATSVDPDIQRAMDRVVQAHKTADRQSTQFAGALPRLREASRSSSLARRFLKLDPEETIFPDAIQSLIDQTENTEQKERLKELRNASRGLLKAAKAKGIDQPDTHFAVVRLDGDEMGRLLLGDQERIRARWRDIIHPRIVKKLEETDEMKQAGWPSLLGAPRLMGPSLHAFISRSLADFANRIVPWVVEQEYGGCLIYTGGDDVLALAPARDALAMAARLQQLFSAAWIIDTKDDLPAWIWRSEPGSKFDPAEARLRFVIPKPLESVTPEEGRSLDAIELPLGRDQIETPVTPEPIALPDRRFNGQVIAGLGPHQSLSASVVYAHFKTPLGRLLAEGARLLEQVAKAHGKMKQWRGAVALSHRSRSGSKSEIALPWSIPRQGEAQPLGVHEVIRQVVQAFRGKEPQSNRRLANRLPYKLREVAPLLLVEENWPKKLTRGLVLRANDGPLEEYLRDAVLELWRYGYDLHLGDDKRGDPQREKQAVEKSIEGLLLCRYLAGQGTEE